MGRMTLLIVVGAVILVAIITLNINNSNKDMSQNVVNKYELIQAKNYAENGVNFAVKSLSADSTWTGITNKTIGSGSVTIIVQNTSNKYYNGPTAAISSGRLVTSIGISGNTKDTVRAVIQIAPPSSVPTVPDFFKYAVANGGSAALAGNTTITDDNNKSTNANIQVNGSFSMSGNSVVNGFVTYSSSFSASTNTTISPNQNPNNNPTHSQSSPISIPAFNADNYKSLATTVYPGDESISGNTTIGSPTNLQVIYVGGNLSISGNLSAYAVFIVKGSITVSGSISINSENASGNNLGLYAQGSISISGSPVIYANIFSNSSISISGNNDMIYGSVAAVGSTTTGGNTTIHYKQPNTQITSQVWKNSVITESATTMPQVLSYYE
jgi:cytoskeletal protein CcmA (bactofilin family)